MKKNKLFVGRPPAEYPPYHIRIRGPDAMQRYIIKIQPSDLHKRMLIYKDACEKYYEEEGKEIKRKALEAPRHKKIIF